MHSTLQAKEVLLKCSNKLQALDFNTANSGHQVNYIFNPHFSLLKQY